jgi:molybdenum cofactor synthesis domain-containing protein
MLAEIITIGDELLTGNTVDSNSAFIARGLTERGYWVRRITTVADDVDEIVAAVREALGRRPAVLVVAGGLGPTHDDVTMFAVSKALNRPMELREESLRLIADFYRKLYEEGFVDDPEINEARKKMAYLPKGAEALTNPVGAAPGAYILQDDVMIFVLPGMPREMKAMFEQEVLPRIGGRKFIQAKFLAEITDESKLAPILREALKRFNVRIHSSPKGFGRYIGIILFGESREEINETVRFLEAHGIKLEDQRL